MSDDTELLERLLRHMGISNVEDTEEKYDAGQLLLDHMGVSTVEEAEEKYDEQGRTIHEQGRTIQRLDGSAFCTVDELFSPGW